MPDSHVKQPKPLLKRGGARLRSDRSTQNLTEAQCRKIITVTNSAWAAGSPFNRFITVAWELGGIDSKASVAATGQFITMAREWLLARGHPMPWVWVREWGPKFGAHCHILLHVPPDLDPLFRSMPKRWAKKFLGGAYVAGVVQSQRLYPPTSATADPAAYEAQLLGKVHYMLKCAPAILEGKLGMIGMGEKPWGQSCRVYGKRAGVWQGGKGGNRL
jgi:hypothetical protein